MSAKEIIESQMTEMRNEIAETNKQVGRISELADEMHTILSRNPVISPEDYSRLQEIQVLIYSACKRV
jgi:hypothetical protein